MSTSASVSGAIIVLREYEPVKNESKTLSFASTTPLMAFCLVATADFWRPLISRFSFSPKKDCLIVVAMIQLGMVLLLCLFDSLSLIVSAK